MTKNPSRLLALTCAALSFSSLAAAFQSETRKTAPTTRAATPLGAAPVVRPVGNAAVSMRGADAGKLETSQVSPEAAPVALSATAIAQPQGALVSGAAEDGQAVIESMQLKENAGETGLLDSVTGSRHAFDQERVQASRGPSVAVPPVAERRFSFSGLKKAAALGTASLAGIVAAPALAQAAQTVPVESSGVQGVVFFAVLAVMTVAAIIAVRVGLETNHTSEQMRWKFPLIALGILSVAAGVGTVFAIAPALIFSATFVSGLAGLTAGLVLGLANIKEGKRPAALGIAVGLAVGAAAAALFFPTLGALGAAWVAAATGALGLFIVSSKAPLGQYPDTAGKLLTRLAFRVVGSGVMGLAAPVWVPIVLIIAARNGRKERLSP